MNELEFRRRHPQTVSKAERILDAVAKGGDAQSRQEAADQVLSELLELKQYAEQCGMDATQLSLWLDRLTQAFDLFKTVGEPWVEY